jgi:putative protease
LHPARGISCCPETNEKDSTSGLWHAKVIGRLGQPLRVEFNDGEGHVVAGETAMPCAAAEKRPMDVTTLRDQLGRLGDTGFEMGEMQADLEGALIIPVSELNRLRRDLSEQISKLRSLPLRWTLLPFDEEATKVAPFEPKRPGEAEIIVVIREPEQLDPALASGARVIYAEYEDPKKFRAAVARVRAYEQEAGRKVEFWAMGPRIHKQGEARISEIVLSCEADGYLVRNHEDLRAFKGKRLRADFSLNVANGLTAEWLMREHALEGLTVSYDLNSEQVTALFQSAPPEWFEVTVHQHMPMFHMEHCVFCAFLSKGKDYRDCGRPCETHRVKLRDRVGAEHLGDPLTFLVEEAADGGANLGGLGVLEAIHFGFPLQCFRRIERFDDLLNEGHVMLGAADE